VCLRLYEFLFSPALAFGMWQRLCNCTVPSLEVPVQAIRRDSLTKIPGIDLKENPMARTGRATAPWFRETVSIAHHV
jgi:hypothetical protein